MKIKKIVAITVVFQVIFAIFGGRNAFLSHLGVSEIPERCAITSDIPKNPMLDIKKTPKSVKKKHGTYAKTSGKCLEGV